MSQDRKICVGMIAGAHGVNGHVRLRSFTAEPDAIRGYKPLTDENGEREFAIKIKKATNTYFIALVGGVTTRDQAEALRGTKLFVSRSVLPKLKKRQFYESDLLGLAVKDAQGKDGGKVALVHNYGGGPFLEIAPPEGKAYMLPFTKACVPEVDLEQGYIVITPPEGWLAADKPEKRKEPRG